MRTHFLSNVVIRPLRCHGARHEQLLEVLHKESSRARAVLSAITSEQERQPVTLVSQPCPHGMLQQIVLSAQHPS